MRALSGKTLTMLVHVHVKSLVLLESTSTEFMWDKSSVISVLAHCNSEMKCLYWNLHTGAD